MSYQNSRNRGSTAKGKDALRKRRRHRAWRREATKEIRDAINAKIRAEGRPGWVERPRLPNVGIAEYLRRQGFNVRGDDDHGFATF